MHYSRGFVLLAIAAGLLDGVVAQGFGGFGGQGGQGAGAGAGKGGQGQGKGAGGANAGKGGNGAGVAQASGAGGAVAAAPSGTAGGNGGGNANAGGNGGGNGALALDPANVQTGSQSDGQDDTAEAGQAAALTDNANFINFCSGQTLTNGLQVKGGSCNGIVMGQIPSTANMISSLITNPGPGDNIAPNTDFNIDVQTTGLVAGTFTNPDNTYYSSPQQLKGGKVVGHTHVTVQALGNGQKVPDPTQFAFFKGINDAGDGNGGLTAAVAGGLPAGNYRVCTMTSSSNHQPVLMPVAQRGAQDDCNKFTVGGGAGGNAGGNGGGNGGAGTGTGQGAGTGTAGAFGAGTSGTANAGTGGGKGGKGGKGRFRFARRDFIA